MSGPSGASGADIAFNDGVLTKTCNVVNISAEVLINVFASGAFIADLQLPLPQKGGPYTVNGVFQDASCNVCGVVEKHPDNNQDVRMSGSVTVPPVSTFVPVKLQVSYVSS